MIENDFDRRARDHARIADILEDSDACVARTEEIIGCPIGEFVPAQWTIERRAKQR